MSYISDTCNINAHFKLYFPGLPEEIYTRLNSKQLKCINETITKIKYITHTEYYTITAIDILNYDCKNKLYSNSDTVINFVFYKIVL